MKRRVVIFIMLVAAAVFAFTLLRATVYAPQEETFAPPVPVEAFGSASTTPDQLPATLSIPKLGIDADIQYVGVNAKGNMGVPSNYTDVAWYEYGTVPGRMGSAVVAGHVDNGLSLPGVFKRLNEVGVGDEIVVMTEGGERLRFIVEEVTLYPYQEVPTERLFNRRDAVRLNLVTCAGSWVKEGKTYDERLVVYTVLAPSAQGS